MSGFFFLRHERRAGGVGVGDLDEIKFRARPEDHVLREPRKMHGQQRAGGAKFDGEIAIAHGVHGILGNARLASFEIYKIQKLGNKFTIQWQSASGNRTASHRTHIHPQIAIIQSVVVTLEHFNISQNMMGEINRLRALQVSVARNDYIRIFISQFYQSFFQISQF